ncbi:hypothetical protein [Vibrio phage JSF13]|jgi:hypothetical protein|uniref:Uncharacterized protein ORF95 n=1 Tax=Vibrio phage ICP1 TaxID=979525 RepID=F1D1B7_9CAUD|nr:hypothetical protein ViPhICP1_gp095 [Vibrio phage ICP1]ADX88141.1 hypothetical protein TUST1-191_00475 [Vibrio phage ICP1_2006_D]ADX88368.1 hypothetical protein TUST1-182_00475 [Vibrio phage ICP1_2006_C]ADX88595.1 hypothetical protein TUST1-159_00475 [Vibrio phage ICP1_2006_B]ADX88821.1 hypothetical protein TUST1-17_00475 [Vibrio phage ICP1_2006_A]ADX89052.1 hypothetical protein TUST1-15_00500 [Vibrio phage ICP1_2005_A]ADX89278.1 hypothetical protein TUST1-2_00480 [Vibrio phage ICP1_2001_A
MGCKNYMTWNTYPEQGSYLGKRVQVCFHYDTQPEHMFKGKIIRDDMVDETQGLTIILLDDGRVVTSTECQYSIVKEK